MQARSSRLRAPVTGVQQLEPCGSAVAGGLSPREKSFDEWVRRVVCTRWVSSPGQVPVGW